LANWFLRDDTISMQGHNVAVSFTSKNTGQLSGTGCGFTNTQFTIPTSIFIFQSEFVTLSGFNHDRVLQFTRTSRGDIHQTNIGQWLVTIVSHSKDDGGFTRWV